jgi:hypothetical protein
MRLYVDRTQSFAVFFIGLGRPGSGAPRFLRGRERTLKGHRRRGPDRIEVLAYQIFDLLVEIREARFRQAPHVARSDRDLNPGPERLRPR